MFDLLTSRIIAGTFFCLQAAFWSIKRKDYATVMIILLAFLQIIIGLVILPITISQTEIQIAGLIISTLGIALTIWIREVLGKNWHSKKKKT